MYIYYIYRSIYLNLTPRPCLDRRYDDDYVLREEAQQQGIKRKLETTINGRHTEEAGATDVKSSSEA